MISDIPWGGLAAVGGNASAGACQPTFSQIEESDLDCAIVERGCHPDVECGAKEIESDMVAALSWPKAFQPLIDVQEQMAAVGKAKRSIPRRLNEPCTMPLQPAFAPV
jgi:hypothetical protein